MDVRREIIVWLWSRVRERALANGFTSAWGMRSIVCLQKKVAAWNRCTRREDEGDGQMMSHREEVVIDS